VVSDSKLSMLIDNSVSLSKSLEDFLDVSTVLHGNDSELIFLIHPHKECLLGVVEDSSGFRPLLDTTIMISFKKL
jgi:hypothetical protein